MKTALLISTYNRPESLRICLESVRKQKRLPDEVIIADDGSGDETRKLIMETSRDFPVPIRHVWHPDEGFQLAKIRNKAIASTDADYIIQTDGDIILHPRYIGDILKLAKPGYCLLGSRVMLGPELTKKIENSHKAPRIYFWNRGIEEQRVKTLYLPFLSKLSTHYKRNGRKPMGCAMSFWRKDFIAINGYDEGFIGWGCEDVDLLLRLYKTGVQSHKLLQVGLMYHLWHRLADRSNILENVKRCEEMNKDMIRCSLGVSQYLNQPL